MQTSQTDNSLTTEAEESGSHPVANRILRAVVICEDAATGQRADEFCDGFAETIGEGCQIKKNKWDFDRLYIPEIRNLAASAAADADIVFFSVSGKKDLPVEIRAWVEMWSWLIDNNKPILAAIFGESPETTHVPVIRSYLRTIAAAKRIDYFPHPASSEIQDRIASAWIGSSLGNFSGLIRERLKLWRNGSSSAPELVAGDRGGMTVGRTDIPAPEAAEAPDGAASSLPQNCRTILIVDECEVLCELIATILGTLGHKTLTATDSVAALRVLDSEHAERIDLLLADAEVPDMRGGIMAHLFREKYPSGKVLFMTNTAGKQHFPGEEHFLQKPFSIAALDAKLQEIFGNKPASVPHQVC
jgi:CheY-like chemotaxis protein